MIKDAMNKNENVSVNDREIEALKEYFPACFHDGEFDLERFKEYLADQLVVRNDGYELKFLGKNYGRLLASMDTTTVVVPDEEHNSKPENADSQNIYISGDNLDGLKHLLKSYAHSVQCIYIDPPYNTGSDGFVYNDRFDFTAEELAEKLSIDETHAQRILDLAKRGSASHSAWLMFMYPRLLLARDLLSDDGVIFISIDDNEQANLKLLCDDVFGEENFLCCISRATGTPTGGGFDGVVNELDYILVYARKIENAVISGLQMNEKDVAIYKEIDENGNKYLTRSLRRTGGEDRREDRPTMYYPMVAPDGTKIYPIGPTGYESRWICAPMRARQLEEEGLIEWKKTEINGVSTWHPYQKYYLENRTKKPGNLWRELILDEYIENPYMWDDISGNKKATKEIRDLFDGKKVFETAKPVELIERIINIACKDTSIILDFFSGSATTAHALMQLNAACSSPRRYILIQIPEMVRAGGDADKAGYHTIDKIGMERILRAAKKIKEEHPDTTADLGFKHYTLKEPSADTLDKLEQFDPDLLYAEGDLLAEFGEPTVLVTWLVRDGYGLTSSALPVDFAGYKGFWKDKHLYLIEKGLTNEAIAAILEKYETDTAFNPENIILFGYSFTWSALENLKNNLLQLKDTEKNLRINFEMRF